MQTLPGLSLIKSIKTLALLRFMIFTRLMNRNIPRCSVVRKSGIVTLPKKANAFYDAIHKILDTKFMNGDAPRIWSGKPSSHDVVYLLMDFNGCGFKIANMAPNLQILWSRVFKL